MTTAATNLESESQPPEDKVEQTFELLAAAKKLESESSYWDATVKFVQAHKLLKELAKEEHEKATTAAAVVVAEDKNSSTEEEVGNSMSIASLYTSKAEEYWRKSRYCLIKAMEEEKTRDEQTKEVETSNEEPKETGDNDKNKNVVEKPTDENPPCVCASLDEDQAWSRNQSFAVLFSRPLAATVAEKAPEQNHSLHAGTGAAPEEAAVGRNNNDDNGDEHIADEGDLEARLRALNQSLPSGFKTVNERMSDVHKGLGKLGMSSLYTQQQQPSSRLYDDELPKSEDEQIDEIMAQAEDEAMMGKMNNGEGGDVGSPSKTKRAASANDNDQDSCFSDDNSESGDSEGDDLLDTDQLTMKTIQKQVVKAQVKLGELLALLDQARAKRAKEEMDEEEDVFKRDDDGADTDEEDSFREVQKHDVAFLMMTGKKKLKSAQRDMKKALAEWEDLIL